jgi:hypothetical protein
MDIDTYVRMTACACCGQMIPVQRSAFVNPERESTVTKDDQRERALSQALSFQRWNSFETHDDEVRFWNSSSAVSILNSSGVRVRTFVLAFADPAALQPSAYLLLSSSGVRVRTFVYLAPQVSEFVLLESLKQAGCMDWRMLKACQGWSSPPYSLSVITRVQVVSGAVS